MFAQNDENQNEIATALLEDVIMDVITSNRKKPSVPGIILETIIDIVNGVVDVEAAVPSEQSSAISSDVLASVALSIVEDIIEEVIQSNNRQPSVPGVVLRLITEMITSGDSNNNEHEQSSQQPMTTATTAALEKQTADGEKVKKFGPSEVQKQKDAVRAQPMRKVCVNRLITILR